MLVYQSSAKGSQLWPSSFPHCTKILTPTVLPELQDQVPTVVEQHPVVIPSEVEGFNVELSSMGMCLSTPAGSCMNPHNGSPLSEVLWHSEMFPIH